MTSRTYTVDGMTCDHCVNAITGEVEKVAGVVGVAVDLQTKSVEVTGETLDDATIREAIDDAGYTVVG